MSRFLEINSLNPKVVQYKVAEVLVYSSSTLQRHGHVLILQRS